ncbi:unnamed protein product [Oikopleura dioica]|uniref:U3 small nucleolar RNA-associated protein 13 C-terminal domain-containing protein n=1 Tax=Oikopleura dioica TaxID=34765 RepID=E4Y975_OIKDI|nr:unnamed protein product [Oikopleura dioica]
MSLKYREKYRFGPFFTGKERGDCAYCELSDRLFCIFGDAVTVIDMKSGQKENEISFEGDLVSCLQISKDGSILVVATRSGLLRQYSTEEFQLERTWKCLHNGPVRVLAFDPTSTFLASGGSDGTVKIWDVIRKFCTHNLKEHEGLIQTIEFHPKKLHVLVSCNSHKIKRWDLLTSSVVSVYDSHVSNVSATKFIDEDHFISSGRDSVVLKWAIEENEDVLETLPTYEPIEDMIVLENEEAYLTVGVRGQVRKWNLDGKEIEKEANRRDKTPEQPDLESYVKIIKCKNGAIVLDNAQNFHQISENLNREITLNGNFEEVIATAWLSRETFAAATNSPEIHVRNLKNGHARVLAGHSHAVISIDAFGKMIVSGSRDNSVKLWIENEESGIYENVATVGGHMGAVTGLKFFSNGEKFVSCSEDKTVKLWKVEGEKVTCCWTVYDHEKAVNGIAISPNNALIASAGADKKCVLYRAEDGAKIAEFEGHKKGIWSCAFSPVDQVIATGSADGDIRIWHLKEQTCIKALEGSDCSVLDLIWSKSGDDLISCGSDGVVRIWSLQNAQQTEALEAHSERCWAISGQEDLSLIISAGGDGQIVVWEDCTEAVREEEQKKLIEQHMEMQTMNNMMQTKQFKKALEIAVRLGKPGAAMKALKEMSKEDINETVPILKSSTKMKLLEFCTTWNKNSKTAYVAQITMASIFKSMPLEELLKDFSLRKNVEGLLPFTDRYRRRIDNLKIQSRFASFAISTVKIAPQMET